MDWMIAIDGPDGPVFDGPQELRNEPFWDLYAASPTVDPDEAAVAARSGPYFGEWKMYRYGEGLTYAQAYRSARGLGLGGAPIGGTSLEVVR